MIARTDGSRKGANPWREVSDRQMPKRIAQHPPSMLHSAPYRDVVVDALAAVVLVVESMVDDVVVVVVVVVVFVVVVSRRKRKPATNWEEVGISWRLRWRNAFLV